MGNTFPEITAPRRRKGWEKMTQTDTVRLLRECDAGLKMGARTLDEMLGHVKTAELREKLIGSMEEHERLIMRVSSELKKEGADGKEPAAAKGMSRLKTGMRLAMDSSESTAAELVYDGCYMGMKALHRYKNRYIGADSRAKELCDGIISAELGLSEDMQPYL